MFPAQSHYLSIISSMFCSKWVITEHDRNNQQCNHKLICCAQWIKTLTGLGLLLVRIWGLWLNWVMQQCMIIRVGLPHTIMIVRKALFQDPSAQFCFIRIPLELFVNLSFLSHYCFVHSLISSWYSGKAEDINRKNGGGKRKNLQNSENCSSYTGAYAAVPFLLGEGWGKKEKCTYVLFMFSTGIKVTQYMLVSCSLRRAIGRNTSSRSPAHKG